MKQGWSGARSCRGFTGGSGINPLLVRLARYSVRGVDGGFVGYPQRDAYGVALLAFAMVWLPWLGRNYALSGTPFGTAGYAIYQGTPFLQDDQLERAFNPDFSTTFTGFFWTKLISNLRDIVEKVPRLGGTWASAFFLAGVLVAFRNPALRRTRSFLLWCLLLLMGVQALGKTWLSTDSPELTAENLLLPCSLLC